MTTTASEWVAKHSGGGRAYLTAALISKFKPAGTIAEEPYTEEVQFSGEEPKEIFRIPIDLDQGVEVTGKKGTSERTEFLWSPGSNAVGLLIEQLGENQAEWVKKHGHFEQKVIGNFAPWCFIPDSGKAPASKAAPKTKSPKSDFKCGMCSAHFPTAAELKDHINRAH